MACNHYHSIMRRKSVNMLTSRGCFLQENSCVGVPQEETCFESLILACLQVYRDLLALVTFLQVHSNSKEVSYLSWQNTFPNLKTTCHIKLKFFWWTKLPENLLLAKYLISVTASLTSGNSHMLWVHHKRKFLLLCKFLNGRIEKVFWKTVLKLSFFGRFLIDHVKTIIRKIKSKASAI